MTSSGSARTSRPNWTSCARSWGRTPASTCGSGGRSGCGPPGGRSTTRTRSSRSSPFWKRPSRNSGSRGARSIPEVVMLGNKDAVATIAVKDLAAARQFYEGTLGLRLLDTEGQEVLVFRSGNSRVNVYRSGYAGSNQATAVTWAVGDELEALVRGL